MNQEIIESYDETKEELKRAEHLLFVTLKYTRTCEVMKNTLFRLINTYAKGIDTLLDYALEKQRISSKPVAILLKCNVVLEAFPSKELETYVNFYKTIRNIFKAEFQKREEFRRHVCILAEVNEELFIEVSMDDLYIYFLRTQDFLGYVKNIITKS